MTLATIDPRRSITVAEAEAHANNIVNEYAGWAKVLIRVVEEKRLYAVISDKKYLEFEAWQLIGTFDHAKADTDDVAPIEREGEIVGYICHAKVIKDGIRIGGATQMCGLDAFPCRGKEGSAKDNAAISAAQTWAASKAFKMLYSAVAVLGGFGAATAEEMRRMEEEGPDKTQHWCEAHQTNWFKRGKMRNFAHPIGDTKEWCNEPSTIVQTIPTVESPDQGPAHAMTFDQLQAAVEESGMTWEHFEIQVLGKSWVLFSKIPGASVEVARIRWEHWKQQQSAQADHP